MKKKDEIMITAQSKANQKREKKGQRKDGTNIKQIASSSLKPNHINNYIKYKSHQYSI